MKRSRAGGLNRARRGLPLRSTDVARLMRDEPTPA